ncbi:histidine kinase [Verrucosispora sp. WMMD1129]|uniref:sensor histidine kinase n=1 Tax=Verrucosispora sp. WMMD1129 TaxID=3016093 RepID=UPI00249C8A8A|nr:histidine kinase [Verrucosispora sp. WMMD1129]WFE48366.1 histidine kinase [Verrucosispora sp. WMMD1129]
MARCRVLPVAVDMFLVVVAAVVGAGLELADPDVGTKLIPAPTQAYVAAQVLAAAMLLLRRRHPYTAASIIAVISLFAPAWAAVLVSYAVTAHGDGRRRRQWSVIALLTVAFLVGARAWDIDDPFTAPIVIVFGAVLGLYVRARRGLLAELTDRAERAERERLLLAEQARADERIRLAGEMHDVVTHRINLMVLQAGALRVSTTDPTARAAAEELRVTGCQALAELRDLVGVLRSEGGTPDAGEEPSAVPALAELVDQSRTVGLPVRLAEEGDPGAVAPTVRRTLFRVVQESLTNVHKHASGAAATVTVNYGRHDVRVRVSNSRPNRPPDADLSAAGGGSGLAGLRHRVEVLGGTMTVGATEDGGFTVDADLPANVPTAVRR